MEKKKFPHANPVETYIYQKESWLSVSSHTQLYWPEELTQVKEQKS